MANTSLLVSTDNTHPAGILSDSFRTSNLFVQFSDKGLSSTDFFSNNFHPYGIKSINMKQYIDKNNKIVANLMLGDCTYSADDDDSKINIQYTDNQFVVYE